MSLVSPYIHPAKLISYDNTNRTAKVSIAGLTDGVEEGITAMIAYPIGDDDMDTERELLAGADVWVFFEQGDTTMPVIAFYRRHGQGRAVVDIRRIRQENIEVLARSAITLDAKDLVHIKAKTITIDATTVNLNASNFNVTAETSVNGNSTSYGNQTINGSVSATGDIKAGGISLKSHKHGGVDTGGGSTSGPQ
ncbi:hypothetical protein [Psychrobacter aquimaris]|uniref:hypothetical protein n=1 Tax=Psychrobacter aquimaris TaxID=292733 RepID=UPI0018DF720A|nr:hypothetical protein [Psychrobacter aquimaris]